MNIAQIRAKYPQYNDLSDRQLADALHSKFYSDLPIGDYYKRIGFTSGPPPVAESPLISKAKEYLPPAAVETIQQFTDIPVGFQRGVTQGIRMLSDVFGANNAVSQALRRNEETLTSLMSAQARNDQQEVSRILKEAEDKGTLDQVKAGVKAFTVAPVDTLVSALGTAAPAIVGALGAKVLGAGALIGTGVSALTGAAMGTGAVKGTIYEETKQALINAGATEQEAEKRAQLAQEYGGKNLDQILLGTAIGGVAAVGPLEKGAARMLATRISKNIAAREAAEQAGTTGLRGRAVAGVAEALPEAGQAAQEQIAANIAQQREGLEVPTFRGAVSSATMEGLAGAGLGATLGRPGTRPEPAAVTEETPIEKARREAEAIAPPAPAPEAAAPPVEEPIVRKPGEPKPLPETLDDATIRSIGFTRGKIRDALMGKAITDPEIRTVLEEYKQRPNASAKTAAKIDAFLARLPEAAAPPVPTPAPPAPVEAAAEITPPAGTALTFETAKGSQYSVFDDGTTQRNKAPRPEHPGDQGVKERTARTIYVDGDASRLSAAGVTGMEGARVIIDDDGTASLVWKNPKTGKLGSSSVSSKIKFYTEPAVGRSPLELWGKTDVEGREGYTGMHAGNKIVKITPAAAPVAPPPVVEAPTPPTVPPVEAPVGGAPTATSSALLQQTNQWDQRNRRDRSGAWFDGGKADDDARAGFAAAAQNGGDTLPSHGMSKESTLSGGVNNLLNLLQNGLDPKRGSGRLDYAPLVTRPGSAAAAVSTTPGGSAYSDGPFILVARPGREFEGKLEGVGAILVNQAHPEIVPALREAVQAIRPDILVEPFSNAGEVARRLTTTPEAPSVPTATTEPAPSGAGPGVAGGPPAVTPAAGVGGVEPTGVVPAAPDVGQPAGGKAAAPASVAAAPAPAPEPAPAPKPAPLPEYTEEDVDRAVATGLMTEEQAETYRAELREEEAPSTAMGAAFEKQVADIKAQMDALRQKNGKPPAPKSKNRAKYDELQAQLDALTPKEEGDLIERLEKIGATGVVGTRGERPVIDLDALRENLIKARAAPRLQEAILTYIGVDKDGNYLPTTYSREEAAEMAGLGRSSGANITRTAQALGITADVVSRFHAGQTDIIVRGKNVSEAGTGATDLQPTRGVLYEAPTKGKAGRAAGFLRGALTSDGKLDFSNVPLNSKKATKDSPAVTGLAEIYARASNYDPKRGNNEEVIKQLNAEIAARTKADRKGMQSALDRAYRVVRAEEEAAAEQAETERVAEEGVDAEDVEAEDKTRRLSDEEADDRYARGVEVESPDLNTEQVQALKDNDLSQAMALVSVDPTADRVHRAVAKRLAQLLDGTRVELVNNLTNDKGRPILGRAMVSGEVIQLDRDRGVTQEVLLHEGVHAAAERVLVADEKLLSPQQLAAKRELQKLFEAVQKDPDITSVDAKTSLSEFVAEVMSNRQLQGQLGKKPWRMSDAMQQFKSIVLRLLGVKDAKSMLASAMASVDAIFTPTSTQIGTTPTGTREARAPTDVIGERKERTLREDIGRELKGNKLLRLREKFTDSMAPVDDLFTNAYGGKVRDRMGNLNPMVLLSRALDALRISKAVQEQGGLTKVDGLWVAEERDLSYSKVLSRIAEEAKKQKKTYDKFAKELGTLLYAHREYNLREKNKTLKKEDQITLLLDDPTLDKLEADFQSNEFAQDVLKDLDTIRFDLIDKLVESGRISEETAQEWKDNTGYIPFERIGEYENAYASAKGANRGAAALKKMRALEGSKRQTVNPIENFSGLVDWMVKETIKNEASVRALDDMVLLGAAKKVPSADAVAKDAEGAVVPVYKGGVPAVYYLLDAAHLPTFSLIDRKVPNTFKLMQKGSQILRAGVTGMPPFAIKQIFDDIARAYAYAGVENNAELVKRILTNFPKNWFNEIFKRKTASAKEMERLGIVGTFDFSQTGNLQNIMEQAGAKKEGLGKAMLRVMEAGAKASDLAVRQAIYDQVKKETGDTAAAESAAREIINFSRRGSSGTMNLLISVIPFFNAYARGMDKLAVAAAGKTVGKSVGVARSMFYKRMGMLTAMGLLYALAMQDDEEYQSLPDHVRDTNWVLPGGKYLGYTPVIPVPAELAFFFKAIPERVVQYMKYQGTDEERAGIDLLGNMVMRGIDVFSSPNITPQVLRPMLENYINYSFFLGRPLESQAQQALEPYMREGMGTSDTMKALAKNINDFAESTGFEALKISPIKLENLVRGMLGTGAGLALSMADAVTNPDRTDRPLHQQLTPQLTGASALMKDSVGTRMMDEIYKLDRRTEQAHNSLNRLMKNNPEEIESYMEQNKGILGIRPIVKSTMDAIRTLNEQARTIDKDKAMSPEERRKLINELRVEQNNIAKTVFSLRKQARDIQYGL